MCANFRTLHGHTLGRLIRYSNWKVAPVAVSEGQSVVRNCLECFAAACELRFMQTKLDAPLILNWEVAILEAYGY